jgi:hypothetical protein
MSSFFNRLSLVLVIGLMGLSSNQAHGWGALGHQIVAHVGAAGAGGFWDANNAGMVKLTTAPDAVYKRLPTANTEKPTHFFQPDSYFEDPSQFSLIPQVYNAAVAKWGASFVNKNGTAPWRARQFYDLAVQALRNGDYKTGLEYAGIMSHYIGDMSQPLHDTSNYDGVDTGQKGIHAFFETTNIKIADVDETTAAVVQVAKALLADPKFRNDFKGNLNNVAFNEVNRAYAYKDTLLAIDKKQGRSGAGAKNLLKLAIARMGDGAATLAMVLEHIWVDAGNPTGGETVDVEVPTWEKPNYGSQSMLASSESVEDDDCLQ